ncbi:triose-phosphate isomerase [uncultured Tenacibaculum sp.]|uniref:triose-phosphate isomerase n=1 Tax=uncultured Tenacibaculum sp. TaxID=174713 RepID=UPI00261F9653|nr:triose-phosphate isomerase [uncultured Tenacibaculum sp.]
MRQKIVAGNWKMNNTLGETKELLKGLKKELKGLKLDNTRVIIAPTFVNLQHTVKKTEKSSIEVSAQNLHEAQNGAYTGEISADMLLDIGVKNVILGHSERRAYFNETDEALAQKVNTAVGKGLDVIFCFGEQLEDRNSGNHFAVVEDQLKKALFGLQSEAFKNIILAYEPVWAIGTGQTATADQAQEMHEFIRGLLAKAYDAKLADGVSILYGGSVKPNNAKEIFSKPDVDGGLIGGASLKAKDFSEIVKSI